MQKFALNNGTQAQRCGACGGMAPRLFGVADDIYKAVELPRAQHVCASCADSALQAAAPTHPTICPNCGQWQHGGDCFNECARRGFAG